MGQIADAAQKYKARLDAAGLVAVGHEGQKAIEAAVRRACVGLDIDFDEVEVVTADHVPAIAVALTCGVNPIAVATGQWLEGYIVGRLDAEARQGEGVRG